MPGITYKFENQHILTFEDNFRFMDEFQFAIYFDLETRCGKKIFEKIYNGDKKMFCGSHSSLLRAE